MKLPENETESFTHTLRYFTLLMIMLKPPKRVATKHRQCTPLA